LREVLPGLIAAAAVMLAGMWAAEGLGVVILRSRGIDPAGKASPISGISVAIVIGLLIGNLAGLPALLRPGLAFAVKRVLRVGIVLVGLKLAFAEVLSLGAYGVPFVLGVIVTGLVVTALLAKLFRVSPRLGILTAAATSICGVTAAVSTAPVIGATDEEVAYTVANVTLFGLVAMFCYPMVAHMMFADVSSSAGLFLGSAIHDTSQVMGAALSYRDVYSDEMAFKVATVTKLTRNLFIAAVVPLLGWFYARSESSAEKGSRGSLLPAFVLVFVAMAVVRSVGDALWGDASTWTAIHRFFGDKASYWCLGTAMAAVGLSTNIRSLRKLGLAPLLLGAAAALVVGATGMLLAAMIGPMIRL
jgi:uncharacterized integral membrane protein (TIGR00698 family)